MMPFSETVSIMNGNETEKTGAITERPKLKLDTKLNDV